MRERASGGLRTAALAATLLALALCGAGCGRPERMVAHDLVAELPNARRAAETGKIDFGEPASRRHLSSGWSFRERGKEGESFVWGHGDRSVLSFELFWVRPLTLAFRCRPYRGLPDDSPQSLSLSLNGVPLTELELSRKIADYGVTLPPERLVEGANELVFAYRHTGPPRPGARRSRLAVQWYELVLGGATSVGLPAELPSREDAIFLPYSTRLDYYLRLPPESTLSLAELRAHGARGGRLEVLMATDEEGRTRVGELAGGETPRPLQLTGERSAVARLRLRARPDTGGLSASEGLWLTAPRVLAASTDRTASTAPAAAGERPGAARGRPNVILYLVDTLRADRLGCYGHPGGLSPHIDRFAAEATLFERSVSQSSWTRASVASIFTGLWPNAHGTNRRRERLSDEASTLTEILAEAGYRTAGFVTNANVAGAFGFRQGFETYRLLPWRSHRVNEAVFSWIDEHEGPEPFFLYVHTKDPHDPYRPPAEYRERFAPDLGANFPDRPGKRLPAEYAPGLAALYEGEIAFNDSTFGRLVDYLRQKGLYDDLLLIFLSDHGEEFLEHGGWKHGRELYSESIDVPLIIKFPGLGAGERVEELVQHVDVLPTILDYLGLEVPPFLEGESLLDRIEGPEPEPAPETGLDPTHGPGRAFTFVHLDGPPRMSVIEGKWKLIQKRRRERLVSATLHDLESDPSELADVSGDYPIRFAYLTTLLEEKLRQGRRLELSEAILSKELEEQLRALGYIN